MDKDRYDIGFVFMGQKKPLLYDFFRDRGYAVEFFEFGGRIEIPAAVWKLRKIFNRLQPDIVHTHLVEASLAGLAAAKIVGIKKRTHTRHHSVECHVYYPHGVYYDKAINSLSKKIIAVSNVVADVLIRREGAPAEKVVTIPHGFDLENFAADRATVESMRDQYGLRGRFPVVGSISRFIHWKGIQNTIPAFRRILDEYPRAKLVLANATGPYTEEIHRLLQETLPPDAYVTIEFERNVFSLYRTFDVFAHVPVEKDFEAFGQVYVEALTMEVPSVFTLAGIAGDFIKDRENALVVPFNDAPAIADAIELILKDDELRRKLIACGKRDVWQQFHSSRLAEQFDALYSEL